MNAPNVNGTTGLGILVLCAALVSSGCLVAVATVMDDRMAEDHVTDGKIGSSILNMLSKKDKNLLLDVKPDVWEQRVMLTGVVDDRAIRKEVADFVRADTRVRKLYNEIQIVSTEEKETRREQHQQADKEKTDEGSEGDDLWISSWVKTQLLSTKGITSVNYRLNTVYGVVYILGRARSERELEKVLGLCRSAEGVRDVKHFIEIKPI